MKHSITTIALLALLPLLFGCGKNNPQEVYQKFIKYARNGNVEKIREYMSKGFNNRVTNKEIAVSDEIIVSYPEVDYVKSGNNDNQKIVCSHGKLNGTPTVQSCLLVKEDGKWRVEKLNTHELKECRKRLKNIGMSINIYGQNHGQVSEFPFPPDLKNLAVETNIGLKISDVKCKEYKRKFKYLANKNMKKSDLSKTNIIVYDPNHPGYYILLANSGETTIVEASSLEEASKESGWKIPSK